jgi:hypothetical protein
MSKVSQEYQNELASCIQVCIICLKVVVVASSEPRNTKNKLRLLFEAGYPDGSNVATLKKVEAGVTVTANILLLLSLESF